MAVHRHYGKADAQFSFLKSIGGKTFYSQFGIGGLECAPIWRLQIVLLKVALLLGVHFSANTKFVQQIEGQIITEPAVPIWCNVLLGAEGENSLVAQQYEFEKKILNFGQGTK